MSIAHNHPLYPSTATVLLQEARKLNRVQEAAKEADAALHTRKAKLFGQAVGITLEIGAGSGVNRKYFADLNRYIALEPNKQSCVALHELGSEVLCAQVEAIPLADASVDTVVSSMTLCSVENLPLALQEVKRVLRSGGQFLVIEHVGARKGTVMRFFQRLFRSACHCLDNGCHPDRDTLQTLRTSGLELVAHEEFQLKLKTPLIRDWISARLVKH